MFFHHAFSLLLFYEILDMYSYVINRFYIVFRGLNMHMHIFVKGLGFPRFFLQLHQSLFEEHFNAQMNFCNRYEFHFLAKLFVVSQRSKVIENVKHLSIGLLSVYGCFVGN